MAVYVIGDVQGCYRELMQLLEHVHFNPDRDEVIFSGDMVNRGKGSLETLRFIKGLGSAAAAVLGNHDLHLLAVAEGVTYARRKDTLDAILQAPDRIELLEWLRHQPLFLPRDGFCVVHAGIHPAWSVEDAARLSSEVEALLRSSQMPVLLSEMYGDMPDYWSETLTGWGRYRVITNVLTRMRYLTREGCLDLKEKCAPGTQSKHLTPWLDMPGRVSAEDLIVFGHWSTLGRVHRNNCYGLDTGCLWGGALTALRIEGNELTCFSVPGVGGAEPD